MNQKNLRQLIQMALTIEMEEAKEAGVLGYMARFLIQATLPHSKVTGKEFKRKNGLFKLNIIANSEAGLPYGSIPRLLLAWITTEAFRTKSRHLVLGKTLSSFMESMGLIPTGGRWGTITRLKDQMKRLFASTISCTYDDQKHWAIKNVSLISNADLWWDPIKAVKLDEIKSTISLTEEFFKEIINNPVPIDIRVLKELKRSPLAIDIYCWLTYRFSYLKKATVIPWPIIQAQFGANYSKDVQGGRNFKKAFLRELKKVSLFYQKASFECLQRGLALRESKPHIEKLITL